MGEATSRGQPPGPAAFSKPGAMLELAPPNGSPSPELIEWIWPVFRVVATPTLPRR